MLREIRQKISENDYMIMPENILCQNSLTRELKIRVVGFVLKKLLTYFEMLIVLHALQCVDGSPHLTFCFWHTEFRYKFFGKIHLLESSI